MRNATSTIFQSSPYTLVVQANIFHPTSRQYIKLWKYIFFFSYKENVDLRRHPPSDNGNRPREININEIRKSTRSRKQACRFLRLQNCHIERQQILSTYRMIENEMMASTSYGFSWNSESKLWLPLMNHGRFSLTRTTKRRRHNTTK